MAKCEVCNKGQHFGLKVSHSNRKSNRVWKPNIRKIRVEINGTTRTMNICSKCLRSSRMAKSV